MNLQLLEYMIAISEEKSLSKAADKLFVTQPALSQQLKKLENELDAKLFQREKNELVLTDAGKVYVNGARSVLNIYAKALKEIKEIRGYGKKQITMVYHNALLPLFTEKILPTFTESHHELFVSTIDGNTSIAKDYLINGIADIAVMATKEASHSMLEYIPLRTEELMIAIPDSHRCIGQFKKNGVDFQYLKDDHFILNQTNSYFRTMEKEIFSSYQFTPKVLCEISDHNAAKHMLRNHKGIAFLSSSMISDDNSYVCFSLPTPTAFHIVIAYHKSVVLSKSMKDLILLLLNQSITNC